LLRASQAVRLTSKQFDPAVELVLAACAEPLRQLARNAGEDPDRVVEEVLRRRRPAHGFNPTSGEYIDLVAAGIIDSALAMRLALQTAVGVGVKLLRSTQSH